MLNKLFRKLTKKREDAIVAEVTKTILEFYGVERPSPEVADLINRVEAAIRKF